LPVEGMQFSEWIAREFAVRGYELLPVKLAAEDVGAPHKRERVWFVAYGSKIRREAGQRVHYRKPQKAASFVRPPEWMEFGRGSSGRVRRLSDASILRADDGFPVQMDIDRIGALGDAVVPQCAEVIGRAILEMEKANV
jgi:site-specific DNA-cytosine methylase